MRITIARLRTWIVVLGILLVLAIAGFLAYARYRIHQVARDLPQKLGLEIQQSTDNFTISKSHEGHTLFTLHASKAIQYKISGHLMLHEVSIIIYGKDGSRADRISGSNFEYDPSTKIARAQGPVEIELTDPSAAEAAKKQAPANDRPAPVPIKVATSDLTFNQDSQVASTDQPLTFQKGDASGSARGATYDSGKGTLLLAHDVVLRGQIDDDPVVVKADGANFDRDNRQIYFIRQQTDYQDRHISSDQAVVFFNPAGGADHLTAEGHVHFASDDGSDLRASSGRAQLDPAGQLKQVKLDGGLLFVSHDETHSLHLDSNSGTFTFAAVKAGGKKSSPTHLQLVGAVSVVDQQISLPGDTHGSETRESRADKMDVDMGTDSAGRVQAQSVLANGGAVVNVHTIRANAPQQITNLKGEQIFATVANGHELSSLRATGNTAIEQTTPGGEDRTSSADSLLVKFVPGAPGTGKPAAPKNAAAGMPSVGGHGSQIASAVQEGHATLVQVQPATTSGAEPAKTTASADRITYDGTSHKVELTGGTPRIVQAGSELTASVIDFNQSTGDASASGGIKATYNNLNSAQGKAPANSSEAMHVIADHAALDHAKNETTFFGTGHADARLWQGNNSITAPTITLSRTRQLLTANGPAGSVKAALVENPGRKAKAPGSAAGAPSVVRTTSSSLVYSSAEHKVTLNGGVVAQNTTGTIRASTVELYLNPNGPSASEKAKAAATASNSMGPDGQVDRLIAEDHVQITQGQRSGSGTKLVYTAEDGHFVLTGTSASPPRITDPQHGTVSGSSLIFNDRDDSVVVSHGQSPTMTDTRTNNEARKPIL